MQLPSIADLNEVNRVLLSVVQLSETNGHCSKRALVQLCSSLALGGRSFDHRETLRLARHAGLVSIAGDVVKATDLGRELIGRNPGYQYEITEEQKAFIAEQFVLAGTWQAQARDLFANFSPNYEKVTYEMVPGNAFPTKFGSIVHLLTALGVVVNEDGRLTVTAQYVHLVRSVRSPKPGLSDEQLDSLLRENLKLAHQAEEAVLRWERTRLRSMKRHVEALLTKRISQLDVGAGYDIESFDGDKPLLDPDRFIEVKSSCDSQMRFHWSENERRVAAAKGERYWIYFVGGFSGKLAQQIAPIMIQNPAKRLPAMPEVSIKPMDFLVEGSDTLQLKEFHHGKTRGFFL